MEPMVETVTFVLGAERVRLAEIEANEIRGWTVADRSRAGRKLHGHLETALEEPDAEVAVNEDMRIVLLRILEAMEPGGHMTEAQRALLEAARKPITGIEHL